MFPKTEVYGEPHLNTFSGDSVFVNEFGDFHLLRFRLPENTTSCVERGLLSQVQEQFIERIRAYKNGAGVQIRFGSSRLAPSLSVSVRLSVFVGTDQIEIRQDQSKGNLVQVWLNGALCARCTNKDYFLFQIQQLGEQSYKIATPLFNLTWAPFSLSLVISPQVYSTLADAPSSASEEARECAIDTRGILGSWIDKKLYYQASEEEFRFGQEKQYADSWRVKEGEQIISDWLPEYSTNRTEVVIPPKPEPEDPIFIVMRGKKPNKG